MKTEMTFGERVAATWQTLVEYMRSLPDAGGGHDKIDEDQGQDIAPQ